MLKIRKLILLLVSFAFLFGLSACTTINRSGGVSLPYNSRITVLPLYNNTTAAKSGASTTSMIVSLLQARGVHIESYPMHCDGGISCANNVKQRRAAIAWAKRKHINFVISGSINEWRYKVGLDGEPAVSLSLNIKDLRTGRVIWSAIGSKVGSSRTSLGNTAQTLIGTMLNNVQWS